MRFHATPLVLILLAMAGPVSGCSDNDDVGRVGCNDLLRTFGDVADRCGLDRDVTEDEIEFAVTAGQGCEAIVALRDEEAFYEECLPYIEGFTCEQLTSEDTTYPPSCTMQVLRMEE